MGYEEIGEQVVCQVMGSGKKVDLCHVYGLWTNLPVSKVIRFKGNIVIFVLLFFLIYIHICMYR